MDLGLSKRTAIVTGGASNIGRGMVRALAAEGVNVVIADLDEKLGPKTADGANTLGGGGQTLFIKTDAADFESIQSMVAETVERFGGIDILCNNVGWGMPPQPFEEASLENWEIDMQGFYWSGILCSKAVVPYMKKQQRGVIIFTASVSGRIGLPMLPVYSGAKGAQMASMKSMARELGPSGIRVLAVAPGFTRAAEEEAGDLSCWRKWGWEMMGTEEVERHFLSSVALGRMCKPEDVGNMVAFLVSEKASFCTGNIYPVDGGEQMIS